VSECDEKSIAKGLRRGDRRAWEALYHAYAEKIWVMISRQVGTGSTDVADLVQATFLAAAKSASQYDPDRGVMWQWLSGIARNQIALYYRKRLRQGEMEVALERVSLDGDQWNDWVDGRIELPLEILQSEELAAVVRWTLANLNPEYEVLLVEKYIDGVSMETMASKAGLTLSALSSKLARARRAFRDAFLQSIAADDVKQSSEIQGVANGKSGTK
jgi:RNA polymerase sigma-70 factor (ECF subfamily)